MSDTAIYHAGMRELQDRFDTRRLADRLDERLGRSAFTEQDKSFIESRPMFFLATAGADGRPDCSHKGGDPGFVRVTGPDELEFPSYDGNGQFRSLGNLHANPQVGLLFIDFQSPKRLRVNGHATLLDDPQALARHHGAQLVVRVRVGRIFPNCPRYIHKGGGAELSADTPRPGYEPPPAAWKSMPILAGTLPMAPPLRGGLGLTAPLLDGRRFDGIVLERGKTAGDADTLTFRDGRFRSSACDRFDFGDGPYRATGSAGAITFEAQTESAKWGKLLWHGVVRGARLDCTLTVLREDAPVREKWVLAGEVAP